MSVTEMSLRQLLRADLVRQRQLLTGNPEASTRGLWRGCFSPRFAPVLLCRLAFCSDRAGLRILARLFSMINVVMFGIEIGVRCKIGPGLFLPHTHGTVIGAEEIGSNAVIYQGVTLGAKDLDFSYDAEHRPVVGDNVLIGAGAKVLGGVSIGHGVSIAANAVVLKSMPDNVVVAGIPASVVREKSD